MHVINPVIGHLKADAEKREVRRRAQRGLASDQAKRDRIPLGEAPMADCLSWALSQDHRLEWRDVAALAINDPGQAPQLLWDLHLRGRLASDAYTVVHRIYMSAGLGALEALGPTRWRELFAGARFTQDDLKSSPPSGSTLLFAAAEDTPTVLGLFTPSSALASARAGVLSAAGREPVIYALDADPRRLLSVARPGGADYCDGPWTACNSADVAVDLRRISIPPLPIEIDVFDLGSPCACDSVAEIPWIGEGQLVHLPFPKP